MDIRDILKSFDQLTEGDSTVHKAGPGGYGNRHGTDDVTDQYGKPIGQMSLGKLGAQNEPKRGKGRPPNPDKPKSYDSSALNKAMGVGKAPKPTGKPSVKHSLKEYFSQLEQTLDESGALNAVRDKMQTGQGGALNNIRNNMQQRGAGMPAVNKMNQGVQQRLSAMSGKKVEEAGLAVQPMPATPAVKAQQQMATKPSFMIKDPANPNMPAITTQDPAVVQAAKNGTMSMQKPGAAPTAPGATPAAGAGSQVKPMGEDQLDELSKDTLKSYLKKSTGRADKFHNQGMEQDDDEEASPYFDKRENVSQARRGARDRLKGVFHPKEAPYGMREGGDVGKHNNATTGFDALVRKLTPKYGKEAATKIAGSQLKKIKEADAPQYFAQSSPLSSNNRGVLESKKGVNPFAKKEETDKKKCPPMSHIKKMCQDGKSVAEICKMHPDCDQKELKQMVADCKKKLSEAKMPDTNNNNIPDYAEDGKGPNDTKKKGAAPKKGVNPFAKKTEKKKVKEGMEHNLQAARLEGKSHALRKMPYNCTHDDMEESRCYHDGFKEGLDECYGQMPILGRTAVDESSTDNLDWKSMITPTASIRELRDMFEEYNLPRDIADFLEYAKDARNLGQAMAYFDKKSLEDEDYGNRVDDEYGADITGGYYHLIDLMDQGASLDETEVGTMASYGADKLGEMDKTSYMKQQAIKTPGNTFKAFGQTMSDKNVIDEFAFEALDKQLNAILEDKKVSEGMTVSISKGQQGSPDSVSVSAQDGEADQLLSIIKSAGLGLFGGNEQNGYGAPQGSTAAPGGIEVVDDHDGMMSLMKKLSGGGEVQGSGDYEDEEGSSEEGHMHGAEETCESCGGMMEENHQCDSGEQSVMGEDESEDQMAYEVAEANAPDSGADNTNADVAGNAAANSALATADAGADEEEGQVYSNTTESHYKDPDGDEDSAADKADQADHERRGQEEDDKEDFFHNPRVPADKQLKAPPKEVNVQEAFANLYKKLAILSEESTSEKDAKAEKAGKKVAKDIEYDEDHKGKDDNKAERAGKKVTKDIEYDDKKDMKVDESYANSADDTFEADIDFMTRIISGGLNKQKSTGQTTIPVISGQKSRMGVDGLGSPMKESTDLLKDYMKLSGL